MHATREVSAPGLVVLSPVLLKSQRHPFIRFYPLRCSFRTYVLKYIKLTRNRIGL